MLAAPLAIYLSALVFRLKDAVGSRRYGILGEALAVIFAFLVLTRSLSVLITVVCFAPVLGAGLRYALPTCWHAEPGRRCRSVRRPPSRRPFKRQRLRSLSAYAGGWFLAKCPGHLNPDKFQRILLPGRPSQLRDDLNTLAMAWLPGFEWLDNTYSTFPPALPPWDCWSPLDLCDRRCFGLEAYAVNCRNAFHVAVAIHCVLVFFPKYEACGWISLAMLVAVPNAQVETIPAKSRSF